MTSSENWKAKKTNQACPLPSGKAGNTAVKKQSRPVTHHKTSVSSVKSVAKKELTEEMETKRSGPTEKRLLKGNGFEINKLIENK